MTWSKATTANEDDITSTLEDIVLLQASFFTAVIVLKLSSVFLHLFFSGNF